MKTLLCIWVFVSLFSWAAADDISAVAGAALEGKTFVGHTGPKDGPVNGEDELVFKNGSFLSTACDKWGFEPAPYTATAEPGGVRFASRTKSLKHGQIQWAGVVAGDTLTATYVWTKERWYWFNAHEERWFKGYLRPD